MTAIPASFPFALDVDGPAPQGRLSVFLRYIFAIPQLIAVYLIGIGAQIVTLIAWFVIIFTGKYPAGMMTFATGYLRWSARAMGYIYLLTDKYPPFSLDADDAYPIRFSGEGQVDGRNRLTVFFRILMLIPHIIVLYILGAVASVVLVISWLAALFTGSVPAGMHTFLAGVLRWVVRIQAYALLLTDEYPPFALN
jgi:hypothetical protein